MISVSSATRSLQSPPPPLTSGRISSPSPSSVRFRRPVLVAAYSSTCLSPPKLASSSLYEVLGISVGATGQDIKAAYRRLARNCHPDVAAIGRKDSSADEFMKIHAAYSTLSDPEKRADYDRRLFPIHRTYSGVSASSEPVYPRFSGYPRRNWETDQCW